MDPMPDQSPLIVSLLLDDHAQAHFEELRCRHFPVAHNHTAAHVALFHALPGSRINDVDRSVADATRRRTFDVRVTGVRHLGHGLAYDLHSVELTAMHARLRKRWLDDLTRQDAQPLRAHVTVLSKADPADARALHTALAAGFTPYDVRATGLALWRYRGGPWEPMSQHRFR